MFFGFCGYVELLSTQEQIVLVLPKYCSTTYLDTKKQLCVCQEQENFGPDTHCWEKLATFRQVADMSRHSQLNVLSNHRKKQAFPWAAVTTHFTAERRHLSPWCGGDICALGWGITGHHMRWYGPKPPTTMVHQISCPQLQQRPKFGAQKYPRSMVHLYIRQLKTKWALQNSV